MYESPCPIRTEFQRDRDRILHSKSFRRLKHKTQVFLSPEEDHFRTRLTHTLEVAQISRTIARALHLNEDLVEAIALGHDLGHTPFGHAGEKILDEILSEVSPGSHFHHSEQSLRIVDVLERDGVGLNLTWETRDGILKHSKGEADLTAMEGGDEPATMEGKVVRLCDRVAYINHDLDDALRSGMLTADDIPEECVEILGDTGSRRIGTMVTDIIQNCLDKDTVSMSPELNRVANILKDFLFERVYLGHAARIGEYIRVGTVIQSLYWYYIEIPSRLPYPERLRNIVPHPIAVTDFVAGMTDRYAMNLYKKLFLPSVG